MKVQFAVNLPLEQAYAVKKYKDGFTADSEDEAVPETTVTGEPAASADDSDSNSGFEPGGEA